MRLYEWKNLEESARRALLARPVGGARAEIGQSVREIVAAVRREGDAAVRRLTERFDGVRLAEFAVSGAERAEARRKLSAAQIEALRRAIANVEAFHAAQRLEPLSLEVMPGVRCERIVRPISPVGLYVPAGSAPLPSTVVMLAVPARLAGCPQRVLCTPPRRDGSAHPAVLLAAELCGVDAIFKVGGAQAIAALAYGTPTVPKVHKIFGPGNAWVTEAKQQVASDPEGAACDLPAGPSEVLVIADDTARAELVAADLLAQAEHDPQAQAILVTPSRALAEAVLAAVETQRRTLSRRTILERSLESSRCIVVADLGTAFALANEYAPEHLILEVREPRRWLPEVRNAGSVFLGEWSPEPLGDYCSGTNHVLPTYGYARAYSGLSTLDFVKRMTVQELSAAGLAALGPVAAELARLEGLDAHGEAVSRRLALLGDSVPAGVASSAAPAPSAALAPPSPLALARPEILELEPYAHAPWEPGLARLHANELPWRSSIDASAAGLNRYPEPQPRALVQRLAALYGVAAAEVLVGRGSDELIDLLTRAFCRAGTDSILVSPPTFGMYAVAARIQGAGVVRVPLDPERGFALDERALLEHCAEGVKLVYVCSPNNPTGNRIEEPALLQLASALAGRALLVVDEAYIEFSGAPSLARHVRGHPHLVVLRTLSKAHGLAGARCGALLAAPELVALLRRIIPPYALTQQTLETVLLALEPPQLARARERVAMVREEREKLSAALRGCARVVQVFPSAANFVLVEFDDPAEAFACAREAGFLVRDMRTQPALAQHLRITVGTPEQNARLVAALNALGPLPPARRAAASQRA